MNDVVVEVRAELDALDQDLERARAKLRQFDQSVSSNSQLTKVLGEVEGTLGRTFDKIKTSVPVVDAYLRQQREAVGSHTQLAKVLKEVDGALQNVTKSVGGGGGGGIFGSLISQAGLLQRALPFAFQLVGSAVAGAAAAASTWFGLIRQNKDPLEDMLKEHARLLGHVKTLYTEAADAAEKLAAPARETALLQVLQNKLDVQLQLNELASRMAANLTMQGAAALGGDISPGDRATEAQLQAMKTALDNFNKSIAAGAPAVKEFQRELSAIGLANPDLQKAVDAVLRLGADAAGLEAKNQLLKDMEAALKGIATEAQRARLGLQALEDPAANWGKALQNLIAMAPKANETLLTAQKIAAADRERNAAIANLNVDENIGAGFTKALKDIEAAHSNAVKEILAGNEKVKSSFDAYDNATQRIRDQIAQIELQVQWYGKSSEEVLRLKASQDLWRAAMKAGREDTPALRAEIGQLADDFARTSDALQKLNEQRRLIQSFGRDLLSAFRNGESAVDGLLKALSRVSDRLADMALNNALKWMMGGTGGLSFGSGFGSTAANDNNPMNAMAQAWPQASPGLFNDLWKNRAMQPYAPEEITQPIVEALKPERLAPAMTQGILDAGQVSRTAASATGLFGQPGGPAGHPTGAGGISTQGAMAGVMGVAALVGSFQSGRQSGSPVGGALSGALSGAMAGAMLGSVVPVIGTIIGAIGGAILGGGSGLLGGITGQREQERQRQREAAARWQEAQPAVLAFERESQGIVSGALGQSIEQSRKTHDDLVAIAADARAWDDVERLHETLNANIRRLTLEFLGTWQQTVDALNSGFGQDHPFLRGMESIRDAVEGFEAFISDTQTANADLEAAQHAITNALFALVNAPEPMSELAQTVLDLQGRAQGATTALMQWGHSAEVATAAITNQVAIVMNELRAAFTEDIEREINRITGKGFLNDFADLFERVATLTSDAQLLGADPALITRFFEVTAQKLVDEAELTGDAFAELTTAFPQLTGVVHEFTGAIDEARRTAEQIARAREGLLDRAVMAGLDTSKQGDALIAIDLRAAREREAEARDGNENIVELEATLAAERVRVLADFAARIARLSEALEDRLFLAGLDTSTDAGALAAFDRRAQREMEAVAREDGGLAALTAAVLQAERARLEADLAAAQAQRATDLIRGYEDRIFMAGIDSSTAAGQIAILERSAARDRVAAAEAGSEALLKHDMAVNAEREAINRRSNEAIIAAQRQAADTIRGYLDSISGGAQSLLSPQDRLSAAQDQFEREFALAQAGDAESAGNITRYADAAIQAALGYWGTAAAGNGLIDSITTRLEALMQQFTPGIAGVMPVEPAALSAGSNVIAFPGAAAPAPGDLFAALRAEIAALKDEVRALRADANERLDTGNRLVAAAAEQNHDDLDRIGGGIDEIRRDNVLSAA